MRSGAAILISAVLLAVGAILVVAATQERELAFASGPAPGLVAATIPPRQAVCQRPIHGVAPFSRVAFRVGTHGVPGPTPRSTSDLPRADGSSPPDRFGPARRISRPRRSPSTARFPGGASSPSASGTPAGRSCRFSAACSSAPRSSTRPGSGGRRSLGRGSRFGTTTSPRARSWLRPGHLRARGAVQDPVDRRLDVLAAGGAARDRRTALLARALRALPDDA